MFVPRRPPERRHGYEQQYHTVMAQPEHETMDAKRARMEGSTETHLTRAPAASIILPLPHPMQDGLRSSGEIKKVRYYLHLDHSIIQITRRGSGSLQYSNSSNIDT